jgi:peptidoglycan-associated lipoprotein
MPHRLFAASAVFLAVALAGCSPPSPEAMCSCAIEPPAVGPAPGSEQDLIANVGDRAFFAFDRSSPDEDSLAMLNHQAAWLAKYPKNNILIAGNADERGTETYNLALGQRRADVVRDDLVARGAAPSRIKTISYGKDRPVAAGHDEDAWQQNRNAITSVQGFNTQGN